MPRRLFVHWRAHGMRTVDRVAGVLRRTSVARSAFSSESTPAEVVARRFPSLAGVRVRTDANQPKRVNLVTDTINVPHLYGGVGTALVFGSLLAERSGCELRVVTRSAAPHQGNVALVLGAASVESAAPVSFAYHPDGEAAAGGEVLRANPRDIYLTTSWWTTHAALAAVAPENIVYLLQEDERMFYPYGDDHLRCAEILAHPSLRFVVNTKLLFDHLVTSGLANVAARGEWFEPSFPADLFHDARTAALGPPYQFLYYARPNNTRNLFYRGLEAIDAAIERGLLDPDAWQLCFAGKDIPNLLLPRKVRPRVYQNLSWYAYAAMVRKMDVGLSLMYTPHPSYPPLDLAASGAVAVTNRFPGKTDLSSYSANILCTDLDTPSLVDGIARAVALATDRERRAANHRASQIGRDWRASFASILAKLAPA